MKNHKVTRRQLHSKSDFCFNNYAYDSFFQRKGNSMKDEIEILSAEDKKEITWHSYKCVIATLVREGKLSFFAAAILIKNTRKSLGLPYQKQVSFRLQLT